MQKCAINIWQDFFRSVSVHELLCAFVSFCNGFERNLLYSQLSQHKHLFRRTTLWCWPLSLSSHLTVTVLSIWPNSNSQKKYQANSKTINRINENSLSVQVLPRSITVHFLTLEFLISVHTNFHHTSSNQGANDSHNARMSFTTIASSLVLLSISPPLIWLSISTLSIRKKAKMYLGAPN